MKVIKLKTDNIYPTLKEWWEGHKFPVVDRDMLPQDFFVLFNDKGNPTYAVGLYLTDSNLNWLGFPVSNPEERDKKRGDLQYLFSRVSEYCQIQGYKYLFTTSDTKPVEEALIGACFSEGDTGVKHYIKIL